MEIDIPDPKVDFDIKAISERILENIFASDGCMATDLNHRYELWMKKCNLLFINWKYSNLC